MSAKEREIEQLRCQIERGDAHTERQCAGHLKNLAWSLLPILDGTITYVTCEQLCSAGRVDMLVIADILEFGGQTFRGVYVWELKAPQLPQLYINSQNQACPTHELFKAENQLLNYHNSISKDGHLRERWGIISPDHVRFGGIVMGRDHNIVDPKKKDRIESHALAIQALQIRDSVFYRSHGIRLWTWDRVLTILSTQTISHRKFTGDFKVDSRIILLTTTAGVESSTSEINLNVD